jgi:AmmeMemoRadiSam system protein B
LFYPDDPYELKAVVRAYLDRALAPKVAARPKVLIVPHAGYVYSGPIAAAAYRALEPHAGAVTRVILLGPSHRVPVSGLAVPDVVAFDTPLGRVSLDAALIAELRKLPQVHSTDLPHRLEHSLEVQLPFLQMVLGSFALVPLAVGDAAPDTVAQVLDAAWGGPETLIVVSSDLSHYHGYDEAQRIDRETAVALTRYSPALNDDHACGCRVLNGLMLVARRRALKVETLDLRNSGDTSGDRSRVVGYGAFALYDT